MTSPSGLTNGGNLVSALAQGDYMVRFDTNLKDKGASLIQGDGVEILHSDRYKIKFQVYVNHETRVYIGYGMDVDKVWKMPQADEVFTPPAKRTRFEKHPPILSESWGRGHHRCLVSC